MTRRRAGGGANRGRGPARTAHIAPVSVPTARVPRKPAGPGHDRPRVGVSACLLGEPVRWDGGDKRDAFVVDVLGRLVRFLVVCPEVEVGMSVPRPPVRLSRGAGAPRMVDAASGKDWTETMTRHVERRVEALARAGLDGFVLKSGSPNCGPARVRVHGTRRLGSGLFAAALARRLPDLPIEDEQRLRDPRVCATFLSRLFAYQRRRREGA